MTTQTSSNKTDSGNKGITKADKKAAEKKADGTANNVGRTRPWEDLAATPSLQQEPRDKTVQACALKLLRERGARGATLAEIQASFDEIKMGHHDAKRLLRWMSANRGWGFHMKRDEHIVLRTKNADE
jgi:hypothetical protein